MAGGVLTTFRRAVGHLGAMTWAHWDDVHHAAAVIGTVLLVGIRPRIWVGAVRKAFAWQIMVIGVESVRFTCGVAALVGITVVVQMVHWVREVGQIRMIGSLLALIVARELAPVLVGLVIVHCGSAMVAELGIMKIDGQVHALEAEGVDPFLLLVLPRVLGTAVSAFCLTIIFILVAYASAYLFGAITGTINRDVRLVANVLSGAMSPEDLLVVFCKSVLPGLYTGASCCSAGLDIQASLAEIPRAVHRAVKHSLIALFAISAVISVLTYLR